MKEELIVWVNLEDYSRTMSLVLEIWPRSTDGSARCLDHHGNVLEIRETMAMPRIFAGSSMNLKNIGIQLLSDFANDSFRTALYTVICWLQMNLRSFPGRATYQAVRLNKDNEPYWAGPMPDYEKEQS